ncbi:hypothetical protein ACFP2T_13475 [Plantactinospora solaniradicis]|uniref:Uncharacterized protein n=1 Tax=Plantactinospora solaniradicis TaxID=1723736 RepID=A0ABW1KA85_9ACTN
MQVTYKPEDGGVQSWEFLPGRVRSMEAALVEKTYGKPWEQFCAEVQSGSMKARRALLWHLMRRDHPTTRMEDVPDFYADEVVIEHSLTELLDVRDTLSKADLPEAERTQALAMLDVDIAKAEARGAEPEGKAISKTALLPEPA